MTKKELFDALVEEHNQDSAVLKNYSKAELQAIWDDLADSSDMYPNGRDFDSENEKNI